jgi:CHAT domain-containing protein
VKPRLLIVGQAQTLGQAPLPGTREEIESIKTYVQSPEHYSLLEGDDATPDAVLTSMQMYDWVHLACHAHQHASNPTSSGFLLHNGTLSIFTIAQRNFKNKGLAFLSACQTARGDERLPDEAAHLASAMLMAGYKNVIATMWSIMDVDAPLVADGVYARLLTSRDEDAVHIDAARALHDSVKELREKIGEQNFSRWIPYIHIGQ